MLLSGCHIINIFVHLFVLLSTKRKDFSLSLALTLPLSYYYLSICLGHGTSSCRCCCLCCIRILYAIKFLLVVRLCPCHKPWCSVIFHTSTHCMHKIRNEKFEIRIHGQWLSKSRVESTEKRKNIWKI